MRLWPMTAELYAKDGWAFGQIAARQIRSAPSPACGGGLGRGWHARMSLVACPLPAPPPAGCGLARFRQILEVTKPRQAGVWLEEGTHRVLGNSDHAGPTRSIIAASSGCGARRMAAAPAAASGWETWRDRQKCTGASARSRMPTRVAQSR